MISFFDKFRIVLFIKFYFHP